MKFRELLWEFVGRPDVPPKVFKVKPKKNAYTNKLYMPRHYEMAAMYLDGKSVEEIANCYNVTRERIRQCLWKAYRELTSEE